MESRNHRPLASSPKLPFTSNEEPRLPVPPLPKKKRNRVPTSCLECHKRKQKCNREWPCNHCLSRRVAHLCRYATAKSSVLKGGQSSRSSEIIDQVGPDDDAEISSSKTSDAEADQEIFKDIGHSTHGSETIMENLKDIFPNDASKGASDRQTLSDPRRSREKVLELFPPRPVVDFLIQHLLAEVNWLYEMILPAIFLPQYNAWWSQPDYQSSSSIQFTVLILRLCVNSIQFLPHPNYRLEGIIDVPLDVLERKCNDAALKLDGYRPRAQSLLRVRHLLFNIITLAQAGNPKESYFVLGEAVKEAHDIELFKDERSTRISEYDREERRRTFWNLYVWDRVYCTFLGRWPLIPEEYFDVQLPNPGVFATSTDPEAPSPFTDVLISIQLFRLMPLAMSAPAKRAARQDPIMVETNAQLFQTQFLDKLHPAYRLHDPDTRWDSMIPTIPRKRAFAHMTFYITIATMHGGFISPSIPSSNVDTPAEKIRLRNLAARHKVTLANTFVELINTMQKLHELMGGGPHRYLFLQLTTIEAGASLGVCLIYDTISTIKSLKFEQEMRDKCYEAFERNLDLLKLLAQRRGSSS